MLFLASTVSPVSLFSAPPYALSRGFIFSGDRLRSVMPFFFCNRWIGFEWWAFPPGYRACPLFDPPEQMFSPLRTVLM